MSCLFSTDASQLNKAWELFSRKFFWGLFGIILIIVFFLSVKRSFDRDEFEAIHSAWKLFHGERIYADFFEHHHPLLYYAILPLISFFQDTVTTLLVTRLFIFLMVISILGITYKIAERTLGRGVGLFSLILLSTTVIFIPKAIEIRPDVPEALFALLSIYFFIKYYQNKLLKELILSAVFLAVSFLFLQKIAALVIFMSGVLFFDVCKRNVKIQHLFIFLMILMGMLLPYFFYLFSAKLITSYITYAWVFNLKTPGVLFDANPYMSALWGLYRDQLFIIILWVCCLFFFLKTPAQRRLGVISLFLLSFPFYKGMFFFQQYFLPAMPLMAVLGSSVVYGMIKKNVLAGSLILLLSVPYPIYYYINMAVNNQNSRQMKTLQYVLSNTKPDDFVYDADIMLNVFRKDINFYWYPLTHAKAYQWVTHNAFDIYASIDQYKPVMISSRDLNRKDGRIKNYYHQSAQFPNVLLRIGK